MQKTKIPQIKLRQNKPKNPPKTRQMVNSPWRAISFEMNCWYLFCREGNYFVVLVQLGTSDSTMSQSITPSGGGYHPLGRTGLMRVLVH